MDGPRAGREGPRVHAARCGVSRGSIRTRAVRCRGPLYQRLRQELFARVRRGEFAAGARLPSENELCDTHGVSLTTARRALLELVREGIVQRWHGVDTTIAPQVRDARLAFISIDYQ